MDLVPPLSLLSRCETTAPRAEGWQSISVVLARALLEGPLAAEIDRRPHLLALLSEAADDR